jgi:hypothetical protein
MSGDEIFGVQYNFTIGGADTVVVPQGNHREWVIFNNASANSLFYGFGQSTTGFQGLRQGGGGTPIYISRSMIGGLIDTDIHAIASASNSNGTILIGYRK